MPRPSTSLITHEHVEHFSESRVRAALTDNPSLEVWSVPPVVEALSDWGGRVHAVTGGERFLAAGVSVQAYGQQHAVVHPDVPAIDNTGFLIADRVFHPGDALTVPDVPVETLLVPVHAPWLRVADAIDWVRAIAPGRAVAMHDCGLSRIGRAVVDGLLGQHGPGIGACDVRVRDGERLVLPTPRTGS